MAHNSYWKPYRRIQSNVREHISSIYPPDQFIPENSQYHDDSHSQIKNQHFPYTSQMPESEFHSCVNTDQGEVMTMNLLISCVPGQQSLTSHTLHFSRSWQY